MALWLLQKRRQISSAQLNSAIAEGTDAAEACVNANAHLPALLKGGEFFSESNCTATLLDSDGDLAALSPRKAIIVQGTPGALFNEIRPIT